MVRINADYLPSQNLYCSASAGIEFGTIHYPYGTSYTINHYNPTCEGYASYMGPRRMSLLVCRRQQRVLQRDIDRKWRNIEVFRDFSLAPGEVAACYPNASSVGLNPLYEGYDDQSQWAFAIAHELGHALGLHDALATPSQSVMALAINGASDLSVKDMDKCSIVQIWTRELEEERRKSLQAAVPPSTVGTFACCTYTTSQRRAGGRCCRG